MFTEIKQYNKLSFWIPSKGLWSRLGLYFILILI